MRNVEVNHRIVTAQKEDIQALISKTESEGQTVVRNKINKRDSSTVAEAEV